MWAPAEKSTPVVPASNMVDIFAWLANVLLEDRFYSHQLRVKSIGNHKRVSPHSWGLKTYAVMQKLT